MLAYRKETSQETDADSHKQTYRQQIPVYSCYRKEVDNILENTEFGHHILYRSLIQEIQQSKRYCRSENTDNQTFQYKR